MSRITGVLLAAGQSKRFGAESKLEELINGNSLAARAGDPMAEAKIWPLYAVVRPDDVFMMDIHLAGSAHALIENPRFAEGMGTSIAVAAALVAESDADGMVIGLGDMPFVRAATYRALIDAFERSGGTAIAVAHDGVRRGCPTLFPRACFPALAALGGDEGARTVIAAYDGPVIEVACQPGELDDVDTPEALEAARARLARRG